MRTVPARSDSDYCGNAVSNSSFSKIFGPGMRLGWMEAPAQVRDTITSSGMCASGGGFNHTASGIMTSVIELGLMDKMLAEARPFYKVTGIHSGTCLIISPVHTRIPTCFQLHTFQSRLESTSRGVESRFIQILRDRK